VRRIDALGIGILAARLGAGRRRKDEAIDPAVGLELAMRVGDEVGEGEWAVRIHARTDDDADAVSERLPDLIEFGTEPVATAPWLLERIPR
jgi:thymidine phosphorylase